jgi:hypothetical protein
MLVVEVPGDASVSVNGVSVGRGRWVSDTLKPGPHVLAASVRSVDRCTTARSVDTVFLRTTGDTTVTLNPRPCGFLALSSTPERARYEVLSSGGALVREGSLPLPDSLLLPIGRYRLRLRASYCTTFEDSVRVESGKTNRQQIPMLCDTTQVQRPPSDT